MNKMLVCNIDGCVSNETTQIDGRSIAFFPLPEDDVLKEEWIKKCATHSFDNKDTQFRLCELHFEKTNFIAERELKPDAIPTIFNNTEEIQRKRKADTLSDNELSEVLLQKQKKLEEDSQSPALTANNLVIEKNHLNDTNIKLHEDKTEDKTVVPLDTTVLKEPDNVKSNLQKESGINGNVYRLTIQIEKVFGKPCPRSKKLEMFKNSSNWQGDVTLNVENFSEQNQLFQKTAKKPTCSKANCSLNKTVYDSKPAYHCELCDKYYVEKNSSQKQKGSDCSLHHKTFPLSQSLCLHSKGHFTCDICQTECSSQASYDKHVRLHVSTDPQYPYKCHQCTEIFELKENVRQHCLILHPTIKLQNTVLQVTAPPLTSQTVQQKDYRCTSCNITFRNDQAYRNHVNSHKKKEDLRCSISDTNNIFPIPNPITGSQIGILRAVKFSCRVCSMEFDNVREVDRHTRTHLEDAEEEHKCHICNKSFKSSAQFSEHLRHHLSRAHPCPICPKAFINRTTLKIHLKTHGET